MAGLARPSDEILIGSGIEMTDYEIISYSCCNGGEGEDLFSGTIGHYVSDCFDWGYASDYLEIKINKQCNLYIHLDSNYLNQHGSLNISPETFEQQHTLTKLNNWQLYISELKPGTYMFKKGSKSRCDVEWFFEENKTSSEKIKSSVKDTIVNNKLIQKYVPFLEVE